MDQKRSSDQAEPVDSGIRYPKLSPEMFEKLCQIRGMPFFTGIVFINESGEIENFFELHIDFPKEMVLPGMLELLRRYKEELLDHFKDAPDQEAIMEQLRELAGVEKPKLKVVKRDD